ncbi:MAG: protein arginine kinase [Planctomycetota bacterium]|nr:protein arginine kinase [Planctomycetota bacterium]MDA1140218.1 protein arginine kinase [Planctomycetota bacterium]
MELDDLATRVGEWLRGTGAESDIVISSRVRLARNVDGFHFLTKATLEVKQELESLVRRKLSELDSPKLSYISLNRLSETDREFLVERHLMSKEHAEGSGDRGIALNDDETLSVMINEEDHLRIQAFRSGFELDQAWEEVNALDSLIESRLPFSFNAQFGYLAACPTNVGTGMRASVMLHLPALVLSKQIEKVFRAVTKINLAVRGLYGEGTQATGNFYQISNQATLGKTEEELLNNISSVVPQIIMYERRERERLAKENEKRLEDKVWRALGILKSARRMSSNEALELLSHLRLGVNMQMLKGTTVSQINELLLFSQPAHLQKTLRRELQAPERDVARADFIRNALGGI